MTSRVKKTSHLAGDFLYDGIVSVCEMNSSGSVTAVNVFGGDGLVGRTGASTIYYVFDQQGNVAQRLNSSQSVTSSSTYDAYGAETTTGSPTDPFGYNAKWGYYFDREAGVYKCTFRDYDPSTGRWLTRDPAEYVGGINVYGYCTSDPQLHDYTGLWSNLAKFLMNGGYGPVSPAQCAKLKKELAEKERMLEKWRRRGYNIPGRDPGGRPISPFKGGGLTKPDGHFVKYANAERGLEKMRDLIARFCNDLGPPSPCPAPMPIKDPAREERGGPNWVALGAGAVAVGAGVAAIIFTGGAAAPGVAAVLAL
jgi:RHS repeat-associated protein